MEDSGTTLDSYSVRLRFSGAGAVPQVPNIAELLTSAF